MHEIYLEHRDVYTRNFLVSYLIDFTVYFTFAQMASFLCLPVLADAHERLISSHLHIGKHFKPQQMHGTPNFPSRNILTIKPLF